MAAPAFTDNGESAKDLERPGLRALIALVEQSAIDVVVIQRLDRLTRSPFDLVSVLLPLFEALQHGHIIAGGLSEGFRRPGPDCLADVSRDFSYFKSNWRISASSNRALVSC